jgi:sterol desaturase/sphingolipid hydroxylase (fatty acid hydroxylase superfamily)
VQRGADLRVRTVHLAGKADKMPQRASSYFADLVASPLLASSLSILALVQCTATAAILKWGPSVLVGLVLWTLTEYLMHRFIYHRIAPFRHFHEVHHANPRAYVGAPPVVGTILVFAVSFVPVAAYSLLLANAVSVGMLLGYAFYMMVHHACHFWTLTPGGYLYRVRRHHSVHHFRDHDGNFGVTSSLWDRVFGTRIELSPHHSVAA